MSYKIRHLIIFIGGFFLFCLDQLIKQLSLYIYTSNHLLFGMVGWNPFQNHGVAFSLPLPNILTIAFTVPIIIIIFFLLWHFHQKQNQLRHFISLTLIFWGASSNLLDRFIYKTTIDYYLVGTGVINLADILIVLGFIIYLLPNNFFIKTEK